MMVLESIDWSRITFDVLAIETDPNMRPKGYAESVIKFMALRGYQLTETIGRNTCKLLQVTVYYISTYVALNIKFCYQYIVFLFMIYDIVVQL
jgi:hypothetical protein